MPCAATQTGLWCPLGLNVLQARNPDSNAPIQRLATMRLPWRQNTLRFLPIDAQAPGLLGHICRSISSRTHKHAGKRRAAIMNKTSADATRLTAPPALHWARDSRAHYPRRHGPTSTFYQFFFSVGNTSNGSKIDDRLLRLRHGAGGGDKACCGRSRREPTCRHVSRSSILVYILMCTIFPGLRCCSCFDHEGAKARTCSRRDSERTESSVEKACTAKRVSANFST